jgi:hypothetical protein
MSQHKPTGPAQQPTPIAEQPTAEHPAVATQPAEAVTDPTRRTAEQPALTERLCAGVVRDQPVRRAKRVGDVDPRGIDDGRPDPDRRRPHPSRPRRRLAPARPIARRTLT